MNVTDPEYSLKFLEEVNNFILNIDRIIENTSADTIQSIKESISLLKVIIEDNPNKEKNQNELVTVLFDEQNKRTEKEKQLKSTKTTMECCICFENLIYNIPTSTICGHIFCKKCIETYILDAEKCPVCSHVLDEKSIHRIYI